MVTGAFLAIPLAEVDQAIHQAGETVEAADAEAATERENEKAPGQGA